MNLNNTSQSQSQSPSRDSLFKSDPKITITSSSPKTKTYASNVKYKKLI